MHLYDAHLSILSMIHIFFASNSLFYLCWEFWFIYRVAFDSMGEKLLIKKPQQKQRDPHINFIYANTLHWTMKNGIE